MQVNVLKEPLGEVTQDSLCLGRRQKGPLISGAFPPSLSLPLSSLSLILSLPLPLSFPLSPYFFSSLSLSLSLSSSFLSNCDKSIFDIRPMLSILPSVPRGASAICRLGTACPIIFLRVAHVPGGLKKS